MKKLRDPTGVNSGGAGGRYDFFEESDNLVGWDRLELEVGGKS